MEFLNTMLVGSLVILSGSALAESYEVQVLNTDADGVMVFEPAVLSINPGDSVTFKATNPGHNSESMQGMMPEDAEGWHGSRRYRDFRSGRCLRLPTHSPPYDGYGGSLRSALDRI